MEGLTALNRPIIDVLGRGHTDTVAEVAKAKDGPHEGRPGHRKEQ